MKNLYFAIGLALTGCPVNESAMVESTPVECREYVAEVVEEHKQSEADELETFEQWSTCTVDLDAIKAEFEDFKKNVMDGKYDAMSLSDLQLATLVGQHARERNDLYTACYDTCAILNDCSCLKEHFEAEYQLLVKESGI